MQLPDDPKLIRKQADTYETIALLMACLAGLALFVLFPYQNTRYQESIACPIFTMVWGAGMLGVLAKLTRRKADKKERQRRQ